MPDAAAIRTLATRLARRRVTIGFILAFVVLWGSAPTRDTLMLGAIVALLGEAIRVWAAGHLEKGREVTSSGPYAITRHPLYLGSSVIAAGVAIASNRVVVAATIAAYMAITISAAIWTEEAQLTARFGNQYPAYREGQAPPVNRRFSLARAIRNREYRAVLGLVVAFALLAWKTVR